MRVVATACVLVLAIGAAFAQSPSAEQRAHIAPAGALRVALVKIPFLAKPAGSAVLKGVAPDLGEDMARQLGVPYQPIAFDTPNAGIKALRDGAADLTFLAPTPERVALIDFGPAFMEMEMTLIVPGRRRSTATPMPTRPAAGSSLMSAPRSRRC